MMRTAPTIEELEKRAKLSSLWAFVFFNMIFRDLHELGRPGFLEEIMTGVVDGVQITEGLMLMGGIMIAIPLLMIPLNQFLKSKANRRINLVMSVVQIVSVFGVNRAPDLDDLFFATIEIIALLLILRISYKWKPDRIEE